MKKILFILAIVYCFSIPHTVSQIDLDDIVGAVKDGFGKSVETAEKDADKKVIKDLKDDIAKKLNDPKLKMLMGNFSEALNKFSNESKTGKCLQIMGAYAEVLAYCDMRAETETDPCKKKDWLGIESMILFAGTAINYCPQEFYGLSADGDINDEISKQYEIKIRNYFFGSLTNYDDSIVLGEKQIELLELSNRVKIVYNDALSKFLKDKGKKSYSDLEPEDKQLFNLWSKKLLLDFIGTVKYEFPHIVLYLKFKFANEQLDLKSSNPNLHVDFVGKMFTPEFLVKKTLEIANENGKLKCTPK
ncbi:hypothetical protein [uncultured Tenacibaculum sp.]|uniref:hypothetical protein n=1 Tax=uncultured Tenacibaculum sp. TaxID=174713 RepID=UPI00261DCC69|nr:hypothetical protein [uncultured Tenacibaculum sp.]